MGGVVSGVTGRHEDAGADLTSGRYPHPHEGRGPGTFFVAASDASDSSKARADYFASDYSSDDQAIQAAIDALPSGGGKVVLSEGTFTTEAAILLVDNAVLAGSGPATILINVAGSQHNLIEVNSKTNVVISDLYLNGNKDNVDSGGADTYEELNGIRVHTTSQYVRVERVWATNCYYGGIMIGSGNADANTDILISGCVLIDNRDNGIFVRPGALRVTIDHCLATGGSFSGIQVLRSDYVTIVNCVSHDNGPTEGQGDGIGLEGCEYVTITGNVCQDNGVEGIKLDYTTEGGADRDNAHVVVSGNVCSGNPEQGIMVHRSNDVLVVGNLCDANKYGIQVQTADRVLVANNVLSNSTAQGFRVPDATGEQLIVQGNHILLSASQGIDYQGDQMDLIGNVIAGGSSDGIWCAGDNLNAWSNIFYDNAGEGINVRNGSADHKIFSNRFYNTGSAMNRAVFEESASAGPTEVRFNSISDMDAAPLTLANSSSSARDNSGYVTANSGTATLVNGQTSIAVTHSLDVTPVAGDVMVTPIEAWGAAAQFWISAYSSTTFTITVDGDPGQDVDFAWKAIVL